jgi:hypothetical protein
MRRLLIPILLLTATISAAYSQPDQSRKDVNGKEIRGRELEWTDFLGAVDPSSRWNAYTDWVTSYRFSRPDFAGGRARVKISVQLLLTRNSWVRSEKKSDELLDHERGHFNIGRICSRQIERTINSTYFSASNYHKEIDNAYWVEIGKCKEFEEQYDADTKHYNDREQQMVWNKKIADLLTKVSS